MVLKFNKCPPALSTLSSKGFIEPLRCKGCRSIKKQQINRVRRKDAAIDELEDAMNPLTLDSGRKPTGLKYGGGHGKILIEDQKSEEARLAAKKKRDRERNKNRHQPTAATGTPASSPRAQVSLVLCARSYMCVCE